MSSNSNQYIFFGGEFIPEEEAVVSVRTHAFLYGTSVFEGIRAYWNASDSSLNVFRALEHFDRLHNSAKILRMDLPYTSEQMIDILEELLQKNQYKEDVYIRPIVYKSDLKIGPGLVNVADSFCMFAMPLGDYIDTSKPISVMTSSWRRIDDNVIPARAKVSGSYVNTALAKTEALLNGFSDSVVLDDRGHVCEGSAMNIFMVRDGQLITSAITNNILEGITRDTIMQLATDKLGLKVVQREIDRTELIVADELFFCGTGAQVSSIGSVDHYTVGDGNIGPITAQLQKLYFQLVKGELPEYQPWIRKVLSVV